MNRVLGTEREVERQFLNPLEQVIPALERMGITGDGEYYFSATGLDPHCDMLVLMRSGEQSALCLYCAPTEAVDIHTGKHHTLVRNQTILSDNNVITVITGDVARCKNDANHPNGATFTSEHDAITAEDEGVAFYSLLDYVATLTNSVRAGDILDQAKVAERLKDACSHGDDCL